MRPSEMAVLAEGDLSTGQRWILRAGGASRNRIDGQDETARQGTRPGSGA